MPAEYAMKFGILTGGTVVACVDGTPEMIYGCSGDSLVGVPWMLASPLPFTPKWSRVFLRTSVDIIADWQSRHALLTNYADARNESHLRWLRWLGFTFIARAETHGVAGIPFLQFARIKPNV